MYAGMRASWQHGDAAQHTLLAQQYSQALDEMGFTMGKPGSGGESAWSDAAGQDPSRIRAELAMNNAYLSVNAASFSSRTMTW
jgi:hypothetical protein